MSFKGYMGDYGMTGSGSDDDDEEGSDSPEEEEEEEEEVKESALKKQKTLEKEKFGFEELMKFGYKPPTVKEKQKREARAALDPHVVMLKGSIKYWDATKGFGFISPKEDNTLNPDMEEDVFCHISEFPDCLNKSIPEQGAHVLYQTSKQMKESTLSTGKA